MGRGHRLAEARRAEEEKSRVLQGALRVPEDQASGIANHLAEVRIDCLAIIRKRDEASFKIRDALARMRVLKEVAHLAGVGVAKLKASKGRPRGPGVGASEDAFKVHQRKVVTPPGWADTLGKALLDAADAALEKAEKGEDMEHQTMIYQECLELHRYLCNIDSEGEVAALRLNGQRLRVANGGR